MGTLVSKGTQISESVEVRVCLSRPSVEHPLYLNPGPLISKKLLFLVTLRQIFCFSVFTNAYDVVAVDNLCRITRSSGALGPVQENGAVCRVAAVRR